MINIDSKSRFYKALGDPVRLKIIDILLKKKECMCICELSKSLNKDQSVIFRHIQILKEADIINTVKDARYLMCCIKDRARIKKILGG